MRTFAVANPRPGVGKSTTAANLAGYVASAGAKVLLVDLDPEADLTAIAGRARTVGLAAVLFRGMSLASAIAPSRLRGVDLLMASRELSVAEQRFRSAERPEECVEDLLEEVQSSYSFAFIDCPSDLGMLTLNALVAADAVLIPVSCADPAPAEFAGLMDTIARVQRDYNPHLQILGLIATKFHPNQPDCVQVVADMRRLYPTLVFSTQIPRTRRFSEARDAGRPIMEYDPFSNGAHAYQALAIELAHRCADGV